MLWSLYVWHSEMVIHPVALSEIPRHLCGGLVNGLFSRFHKSIGAGLPVFEMLNCFQSPCLPGWTVLYQKHSKDTSNKHVPVYYMSINKTSSIIFQFCHHSQTFRCKYSGTSQYPAHTHANTHWLAVANRWLGQGSTTSSLVHTPLTDGVKCQPFFLAV